MNNLTNLFVLSLMVCSMNALANSGSSGGGETKAEAPIHTPELPPPAEDEGLKVFKIEESGPDIRVPNKIWEEVFGHGKLKSDEISFIPMRLRFKEKNPGVLVEPEFVVDLPRGGGEVDLLRFVKDKSGTFKIFFELQDVANAKKPRIFYISKARKRKLDGEVWGAGCNKFMDLTDYMLGKAVKNGIEVNTTRSRHLSVLLGHFVFAADKRMTQVTFTDSSQRNLSCDFAEKK